MARLNRVLEIVVVLAMAVPAVASPEQEDVPFELHKGFLIVVKGSIGSLKNLSFVVDTGARRSVVDERIARRLHLRHSGSIEQLAPSRVVEMNQVEMTGLCWGGKTPKARDILTFDLSSISKYVGKRIDLLLGLDVLLQTSFQIDYQLQKIHFGRQPTPENTVPIKPNLPGLVVESQINGHFVNLLLDTACDSLAVFADRLPENSSPSFAEQEKGHDISGPVSFTRIAATQVILGDSELQDAKVFLIPARPEAKGYDGSLAPTVLGASKIYFDFERMRFGWDCPKGSDRRFSS